MFIHIRLDEIMKEKGVSKNKLCQNCKLERTQLNNYCKGKVKRFDLEILVRICEYLDCTVNDILELKSNV